MSNTWKIVLGGFAFSSLALWMLYKQGRYVNTKEAVINLSTAQLDELSKGKTLDLLPAVPNKIYEIVSASYYYQGNGVNHKTGVSTLNLGGLVNYQVGDQGGSAFSKEDSAFASYMFPNEPITMSQSNIDKQGANGTAKIFILYRLLPYINK